MKISRAHAMRLIQAYKVLFISLAIIAGCFLILVTVIIPTFGKISDLAKASAETTKEVDKLRAKVSKLQNLDETVLQKKFDILTSAVPVGQSPTSILTAVGALAGSDVSVTTLSFEPGNISSPSGSPTLANEVPFALTLQGSIGGIAKFLGRAHAGRRLLRVSNVSTQLTEQGALTWNVSISAFYSPVGKSIYSVDQAVVPITSQEENLIAALTKLPLISEAPQSGKPSPSGPGKANPFTR